MRLRLEARRGRARPCAALGKKQFEESERDTGIDGNGRESDRCCRLPLAACGPDRGWSLKASPSARPGRRTAATMPNAAIRSHWCEAGHRRLVRCPESPYVGAMQAQKQVLLAAPEAHQRW